MAANQDVEEVEVEEEEEEETPRKRNPLRIILLILLILALLCVVCFVFFRSRLPVGLPGFPAQQPAAPAIETPAVSPTEALPQPAPQETVAAQATEPPAAGTEQPPATALPEETEQLATQEPGPISITETPVLVEPTQDMGQEHGGEMPTTQPGSEVTATTEPGGEATATTEPGGEAPATVEVTVVPGPTATPTLGATPDTTPVADCANNTPPVAEAGGPYNAMMGKGDAFVTVDGSGSSDADGAIDEYTWDFGDGSPVQSGVSAMHGYSSTGSFVITLTVTDNCGDTAQDTADVTIVGPTPPATITSTVIMTTTPVATGTPTLPPTGQGPDDTHMGILGFCYRVRYGDTLYGLAWYYGVPWPDLARVNDVPPEYYVLEGQGLFIPTEPIQPGPNLYQVEDGDTIYSVAYQCGLPVGKLAWANNTSPDQALTPGDLLVIPPWGWR